MKCARREDDTESGSGTEGRPDRNVPLGLRWRQVQGPLGSNPNAVTDSTMNATVIESDYVKCVCGMTHTVAWRRVKARNECRKSFSKG